MLEFFQTIKYLGGAATAKFVRGPCHHGTGRGGIKEFNFSNANLGGPSDHALRKVQSGYTPFSGVFKGLLEAFQALVFNGPNPSSPVISTNVVQTVACVMALDGTALKPCIQFDDRLKICVGLTDPVDLELVTKHPQLSSEELKGKFVTEAVPYFLTSMDMKNAMPVAVDYVTKSKNGEQGKAAMVEKICTVQVCRKCCQDAKSNNLIVSMASLGQDYCVTYCNVCWTAKKVCINCQRGGQTSHFPALRACTRCLNSRSKCEKVAVVVVTTDCEESNKQALTQLHDDAAKGRAPPELSLLAAMPDVVHLGKSLKCSWSNWILWFKGTRSTLAILYNLRREAEPELRMKLKKLLTEESVRNKDRMAVDPILLLTTPELLDVLQSVNRVVYMIVPEKYRMWSSNRPGMYPHPLSVTCGPFGKLLVVDFDPLKNTSKLLLVRLHSPADVIVLVEDLQNAKSVAFSNGVAFCTEPSSKSIRFVAVERNVTLKVSTLKKKEELQAKLQEFHLSTEGTVAQLRERLKKHLDELQTSHKRTENSIAGVSLERPSALCALSDGILLVADDGSGCFKQVCLNFDGVGIQGTPNLRV